MRGCLLNGCERHKKRPQDRLCGRRLCRNEYRRAREAFAHPWGEKPDAKTPQTSPTPPSSSPPEMPILRRLFGVTNPVEDGAGRRATGVIGCWIARAGRRPGLRAALAMAIGGLSIREPIRCQPRHGAGVPMTAPAIANSSKHRVRVKSVQPTSGTHRPAHRRFAVVASLADSTVIKQLTKIGLVLATREQQTQRRSPRSIRPKPINGGQS
jgi:hypothetical protein